MNVQPDAVENKQEEGIINDTFKEVPILKLKRSPEECLFIKSEPLTEEEIKSDWLKQVINRMKDTASKLRAIGLAAPQLGINKRLFIYADPYSTAETGIMYLTVINPEVIFKKEKFTMEERCYSVDGAFKTKRFKRIAIRCLDEYGTSQMLKPKDKLVAVCFQHEIDHLNGILIAKE